MSLKGGYKILDLSTNPSYDEIAKILDTEKVILVSGLVVEGVKQKDCFASVEENEGVYTLKTPDRTIIISENGEISTNQNVLMSNIVDKNGNLRFIEGNGISLEQEGVEIVYCKWSLSGTHLMFVVAGNVANGTDLSSGKLAQFTLPDFIKDKIVGVYGSNLSYWTMTLYNSQGLTQTKGIYASKTTEGLDLNLSSALVTLTDDRSFRVEFDLLIDVE